ncbi:response regulator [Stieleria varia]|uniref:Response regulator MprA n=1 Tax=Stieleria varia TaxID=2528005 RepID=A0A5C6A6D3_9BACT|nr:response regulator [Stieleria varia]TWT93903.1 Response regulator MprA [Stieleria varia]
MCRTISGIVDLVIQLDFIMTRILLVEDSPTQAIRIAAQLNEDLYEVATAGNGEAAIEMISAFQPDLILSDVQMPVMNGLELVSALHDNLTDIPVVLITATGSDELAMEALERGAAAYLPKSQLGEKLLATVRQVLALTNASESYSELIRSLEYNEFRFVLENKAELVTSLVDLIQRMVAGVGLCDEIGRVRVGMALEHALSNALCHGNLELTKEQLEAEELIVAGEPSLIEWRSTESPFCDRRIRVKVQLTPEEGVFVVRDDGAGFDKSCIREMNDSATLDNDSGQGLVLIRTFMDEVRWNESGNEITMIKRRCPDGAF